MEGSTANVTIIVDKKTRNNTLKISHKVWLSWGIQTKRQGIKLNEFETKHYQGGAIHQVVLNDIK
jgi:hypothetical protein